MSFLSKAWKGVKKVVKKAARAIKKVAKKIAYATPGGKQAWKLSGKIGTKIAGAINKIGPIGMIAISVIAPYLAPLWSAFGAAAAASTSIWGTIGTAIYNGANWAGATLSSLTSGISKGISTVVDGGFSGIAQGSLGEAGKQVMSGLTNAFSGNAGAQGIANGIASASATQAAATAAGTSVWQEAGSEIYRDVVGVTNTGAGEFNVADTEANKALEETMQTYDPTKPFEQPVQMSPVANPVDQMIADGGTNASQATVNAAKTTVDATLQSSGGTLGTTSAQVGAGSSLLDKAMQVGKALTSGYDGQAQQQTYAPIQAGGGSFFNSGISGDGGMGSSGGDFLSQNMLQMMQQTQQRMARGFA